MAKIGGLEGKALLVMERLDSKWVPYSVKAIVFTPKNTESDIADEFQLLETKSACMPKAALKMKVGDRIWVKVVFEIEYFRDYWGEYDMSLIFHKERVLKRKSFAPSRHGRAGRGGAAKINRFDRMNRM